MAAVTDTVTADFTSADHRRRIDRIEADAAAAGLTGVLVTPGPDLVWLTGYQPTALTERLTLLVLVPGREPTMVVPTLERPDVEAAAGASALTLLDWRDGTDPYQVVAPLLRRDGGYGVSDSAWSMHLLGLQRALPGTGYRSLTECLPMARAVKDAAELERIARAGAAADRTYEEIRTVRFAGRHEYDVAADLADLLRGFGH